MEANELRIGNLLKHTNNHIFLRKVWDTIIKLSGQEIFFISVSQTEKNVYYEPIPLTEDWLLKLGFENFDGNMILLSKHPNTYLFVNKIRQNDDCFNSVFMQQYIGDTGNYNIVHLLNINFVHQLQNLYFALTGTELSLKSDI